MFSLFEKVLELPIEESGISPRVYMKERGALLIIENHPLTSSKVKDLVYLITTCCRRLFPIVVGNHKSHFVHCLAVFGVLFQK